jgi:hypothetical protein
MINYVQNNQNATGNASVCIAIVSKERARFANCKSQLIEPL